MRNFIGIDLGGTSISGGIVNKNGEIIHRVFRETDTMGGPTEVLLKIQEIIDELVKDKAIQAVGIGSPGFIDSKEGKVLTVGGNIPQWAGTEIKKELSKVIDIPIFIENDANVAAICESWIGTGKNMNSFIMITIGTGLGGAIYTSNGGIWSGNKYEGAELGHSILYPKGRLCTCGQRGCVEQYISGTAVEIAYTTLTGHKGKGEDIFKLSIKDNICKDIIDKFTEDLAIYLVSLKNIFDPEGIIIGGGVINSREFWWDDMMNYYKEYSNNPIGMEILPAKYLNDAGIIGAAKLAMDNSK